MQSLSKYNKGIKYLLCAIDLFGKYPWVIPIKDKKGSSIINAFKKIISKWSEAESKGQKKTNKIWVDQGSEFYNNTFKDFLKINNIETYSAYNEGRSAAAERFIRTLKNKIFKHMTANSKNVYFDVLDDIIINTITLFIELLKQNPLTLRVILRLNTMKILIKKILTMLEFQNIKTFLLKDIPLTDQKKILLLIKLKIRFLGHTSLMI